MIRPFTAPFRSLTFATTCSAVLLAGLSACTGGDEMSDEPATSADTPAETVSTSTNPIVQLLADGQAVFGAFSEEHSMDGGRASMSAPRSDFQFYSMETGPFDVPLMQEYFAGMVEAEGETALADYPVLVRPPAVHTDPEAVATNVEDAMAAGIVGIVFPHVQTADEAAQTTALMGSPWPLDYDSESVNFIIVEDQEGIANVRDIVQTPGLSVVIAGPGDLRRAYDGDTEAVENAIQTVLSACLEFDIPCGITAGVADIGTRLDQGFRMIIVTEPEAIEVGMRHAGRIATVGRGEG